MTIEALYHTLQQEFAKIVQENHLSQSDIAITSKALSPEEAIGRTERKDFPILTGKEVMLQAQFKDAAGQSFTDAPAAFQGSLETVLAMDVAHDAHARGIFIAALNAVMCHLGLIEKTVHCKNEEPEQCARQLIPYLQKAYGSPNIALVGYQPAMLEQLASTFAVRVLDLNPENVHQVRHHVRIEHGVEDYAAVVLDWADVVLCTGSTLCNGSIVNFLEIGKNVEFFGISAAGACHILGLPRICFCAE